MSESESEARTEPTATPFDRWAVVELMGHARMAGRLTEEKRFGAKLGRLDIPILEVCPTCRGVAVAGCRDCSEDGLTEGVVTVYFGGAAVYRVTLVTEHDARVVALHCPLPVADWGVPDSAFEPSPDPADAIL